MNKLSHTGTYRYFFYECIKTQSVRVSFDRLSVHVTPYSIIHSRKLGFNDSPFLAITDNL